MKWITSALEWIENFFWRAFHTLANAFWRLIEPLYDRVIDLLPDVRMPQIPPSISFAWGVADYWLPLTPALALIALYFAWKVAAVSMRGLLFAIKLARG